MNGFHVRSIRSLAVLAALGLGVAACSDMRPNAGPTSPTPGGTQADHTLPGGAQIRSFDTATCDVSTNTFVSGTEVCAKGTGLGNGFEGTLEWLDPSAVVVRTTNVATNGQFQDRFTPLACGTWTLRLTHGSDVLTHTFTVTNCGVEACSPGFWRNHGDDYADGVAALGSDDFHTLFGLTTVQTGLPADWTLQDALDHAGGTSPGTNPNNANFIGAGAILSAAHGNVAYPYTQADVVAAVQAAYGIGASTVTLDDLNATFEPGHVCPLE